MSSSQIENRNFLSPVGFKFTLTRCPKSAFFSNQANIPELNLGTTYQPSYTRQIPEPGTNITFGDFRLRFLVDEDMSNYIEIQNWIRGLGFPEDLEEIYKLQFDKNIDVENKLDRIENIYSDGTLMIMSSNNRVNCQVKFQNMFPFTLSTILFDATDNDVQYVTAEVGFKYMMYNLVDAKGSPLFPIQRRTSD